MDPQLFDATKRTRLANERTFLAWLRGGLTALAVGIGAGAVVPDLTSVTTWPFVVLGLGFGVLGILLIAYGVVRHRQVERAMDRGDYAGLSVRAAAAFAFIGVALGLIAIVAVLLEV
ncbi:MAG: YidH family protein [Thermoleophilia bacterium]